MTISLNASVPMAWWSMWFWITSWYVKRLVHLIWS